MPNGSDFQPNEDLVFVSYESYEDLPHDVAELVLSYAHANTITELTIEEINEWLWELTYGEPAPIVNDLHERTFGKKDE